VSVGWQVTEVASEKELIVELANRRYLEFISALEDPTVGTKILDKISKPERDRDRVYKGFNFFSYDDRDRGA